jgi:hypothetical protein
LPVRSPLFSQGFFRHLVVQHGLGQQPQWAKNVFNVAGQQGHCDTHFEDFSWAPEYRYNRRLSLQQPSAVAGGGGVGLSG